jgi:hypothetical protein
MTAHRVGLRVVLAILTLYHLGIGLASLLAPAAVIDFGRWFYDVHFPEAGPHVLYMFKAMGMYAVFTGALLLCALRDPVRLRAVVGVAAGLLLLRAFTRLTAFDTLHAGFDVAWSRNVLNVALLLLQAGVLLWAFLALRAEASEQELERTIKAARRDPGLKTRLRQALASGSGSRRLVPVTVPRFDYRATRRD